MTAPLTLSRTAALFTLRPATLDDLPEAVAMFNACSRSNQRGAGRGCRQPDRRDTALRKSGHACNQELYSLREGAARRRGAGDADDRVLS